MFLTLCEKIFGKAPTSGGRAKSRLHFVLVQDRTGLSSDDLAEFKGALVAVIEKYFVIDKEGFDVSYKRENDSTKLLINSPVLVRRQDAPGRKVGSKRSKLKNKIEKTATVEKSKQAQASSSQPAPVT